MGVVVRYNVNKYGERVRYPNWYGEYHSPDGKRRRENLRVPVRGDEGSRAFEESRARAVEALRRIQAEMKDGRQSITIANTRYHALTGERRKETRIADLPGRVYGGAESWRKAKRGFVAAFADWAQGRKLYHVSKVRKADALEYLSGLYDSGGVAYETLKKIRAALRGVFAAALPDGEANPFDGVKVERRRSDRTAHREPMNEAQVRRLLETAGRGSLEYDLIVCGLSTALRRGDVCRIKWESVITDRAGAAAALDIETGKTGARVLLPVFPILGEVLARRRSAAGGSPFVFPEAAAMIETNPDGITYRIKKIFAAAFDETAAGGGSGSGCGAADRSPRVELAMELERITAAVSSSAMPESRKARICRVLELRAKGLDYTRITAKSGISRGAVSNCLHDAERITGCVFTADKRRGGVRDRIASITRTARAVGSHSASRYDFHSLRTTFITLAAKNGVPIDKVLKITGHSSRATVERFYDMARGVDYRADFESALPRAITGIDGV